ncbi:hypothetical protein HanIR_Chr03g0120691 [Helianthus annuus]|nr:hypothetical protein HanIR_Chr03g0120691 [Helianthus annuus]
MQCNWLTCSAASVNPSSGKIVIVSFNINFAFCSSCCTFSTFPSILKSIACKSICSLLCKATLGSNASSLLLLGVKSRQAHADV